MVEHNGATMERANVEQEYNMDLPIEPGSNYLQWQNVEEQILIKT
jgi:hypothetical protein